MYVHTTQQQEKEQDIHSYEYNNQRRCTHQSLELWHSSPSWVKLDGFADNQ